MLGLNKYLSVIGELPMRLLFSGLKNVNTIDEAIICNISKEKAENVGNYQIEKGQKRAPLANQSSHLEWW